MEQFVYSKPSQMYKGLPIQADWEIHGRRCPFSGAWNVQMSRSLLMLAMGFVLVALLMPQWQRSVLAQNDGAAPSPPIMEDVARLKEIVPPSSHPMVEVGYHASAL